VSVRPLRLYDGAQASFVVCIVFNSVKTNGSDVMSVRALQQHIVYFVRAFLDNN